MDGQPIYLSMYIALTYLSAMTEPLDRRPQIIQRCGDPGEI